MARTADSLIVGFDFGHGETALATAHTGKLTAPAVLTLPGSTRKQHITAVAEHPQRGVLVGEEAWSARGTTSFYLGFKDQEFERDGAHKPIAMFVQKIVDDVRRNRLVPENGAVRWVFGAPSGWSKSRREKYERLFRSFGLTRVEVVPESRGALLYARESGELEIVPGKSRGTVLIVDIGSSTTDYTSVIGLEATPADDGNTRLGAALIDKEILKRVLERHQDRALLEDLMQDYPDERRRLELICRRAKESYFLTPQDRFKEDPDARVGAIEAVPTRRGDVIVDVRLSRADMEAVLSAPIGSLGGRSWKAAFHDDLKAAIRRLGRKPDIVLLTGGPSRMDFVVDVCKKVVGSRVQLLRDAEPEFAIARGLALAGRTSVRTSGFRKDVKALAKSRKVEALVESRLPQLAEAMGHAVADGMTERHVIPVFTRWRSKQITTLDDAAAEVAKRLHAELKNPRNVALNAVMADWQNGLRPELEELTRQACVRWGLSPKALTLPPVELHGGTLSVPMSTNVGVDVLEGLASVVNVVVAGVVATSLFGGGAALIASTGPFAVIVAFVGGVWILSEGKDDALAKAKTWDIPGPLRKLKSEEKLKTQLRAEASEREAELAHVLAQQFLAEKQKLVTGVAAGIAAELEALAEEAEFLIK
jgi:hypothetical protein